jgi:hypothetical protein
VAGQPKAAGGWFALLTSLTYYMLRDFLYIYKPIKVVINSSKLKAFKNKSLILIDIKIIYLNNILNIFSIFIKATIKL